jgi:hypothetical protein
LRAFPSMEEVIFCCFSASDLAVYEEILGGKMGSR